MNRAALSIRLLVVARRALLALSISTGFLPAQPTLTITSPKDGTVVGAGQTLQVTVEAQPPDAFRHVILIGPDPIGFSDSLVAPPYRFQLKIPAGTRPRQYAIFPDGITKSGQEGSVEPISIQVEHIGTPSILTAEPDILVFQYVGDECPVAPVARFADADRVDLHESSYTTYVSDNTKVATVTTDGHVKAVGPGSVKITIGYKGLSTVVPVTVRRPLAGR